MTEKNGNNGSNGAKKPASESSAKSSGPLVPQPHGGALSAGNPGNKGGGRPPDAFRRTARRLLQNRKLLPRLADIAEAKVGEIKHVFDADGLAIKQYTETPLREQRGAIEALIKLGVPGGETEGVMLRSDVARRLLETINVLKETASPEAVEIILNRIEPIWRT